MGVRTLENDKDGVLLGLAVAWATFDGWIRGNGDIGVVDDDIIYVHRGVGVGVGVGVVEIAGCIDFTNVFVTATSDGFVDTEDFPFDIGFGSLKPASKHTSKVANDDETVSPLPEVHFIILFNFFPSPVLGGMTLGLDGFFSKLETVATVAVTALVRRDGGGDLVSAE